MSGSFPPFPAQFFHHFFAYPKRGLLELAKGTLEIHQSKTGGGDQDASGTGDAKSQRLGEPPGRFVVENQQGSGPVAPGEGD